MAQPVRDRRNSRAVGGPRKSGRPPPRQQAARPTGERSGPIRSRCAGGHSVSSARATPGESPPTRRLRGKPERAARVCVRVERTAVVGLSRGRGARYWLQRESHD
jgi:hypothetical protein